MQALRSGVFALAVMVAAFAAASATVAGAQGSPAAATSSGASSETTSPTKWANGVCSSVQTWLDSVNSTIKGLKGAGSLDAAATEATAGVKEATDTLKSSLDALGRPSTGDGAKARKAVDDLVEELQALSTSIQQTLADPGSSPVEVAGSLALVANDIGKAANEVKSAGTTLKGLKPNGQLRKAFQSSTSCQKLKKSI
jgi:hypothetical protein